MRKPPPTRGAGGLGRELAARLRVEAERERRIAEIVREHAARGLRADVLGDGTADCPFLILTEPLHREGPRTGDMAVTHAGRPRALPDSGLLPFYFCLLPLTRPSSLRVSPFLT
jgi:hypothetical protein